MLLSASITASSATVSVRAASTASRCDTTRQTSTMTAVAPNAQPKATAQSRTVLPSSIVSSQAGLFMEGWGIGVRPIKPVDGYV
jgi:hypothetical protein